MTEPSLQDDSVSGGKAAAGTMPRMEVRGVTKRYPGVVALSDVSFSIFPGETLAVIGENGAGKSTLMKTLAGIVTPDDGTIRFEGSEVQFRTPREAIDRGVSLIHQELNLHENLSIAENVFLGREPSRWGIVDYRQMVDRAEVFLRRVGLNVDPRTSLARLSTAERQLTEVAKALSTDASVVIMDEPTSSLSLRESERLFDVVAGLKAAAVSVLYISHRLAEVIHLADRVEVMRDGQNAGRLVGDQINHDAMVSAMVGRDVSRLFDRAPYPAGETKLRVSDLRVDELSEKAVSLEVRGGEVVGIAGLVGSGRSELLEAIFGVRAHYGGTVTSGGRLLPSGDVRAAIRSGIALVPEDRKRTGLLLESSVRDNATLVAITDAESAPLLNQTWISTATADLIEKLAVKTASQQTTIANLSGGNQQKIALGKWLIQEPGLLMLDEPTRGVDVGAKQEIYTLLDQLAGRGLAILFVSSELDEVISLADRVLVMHEGGLSGQLMRDELTEQSIMRLAVGIESEHEVQPCN